MITCLIMLIIVLNLSLFFTLMSKKKIDNNFIVSILSIIILLYIFGLFKQLKIGVYAVYAFSIITFIINIILIRKHFDKKLVFTKGFFAFVLVFVLFGLMHKSRMLSSWDEFSHWGDVVKAIYNINDFQTNPLSLSSFKSYPPAMSMFQYFWMNVNGSFNESYLYMAFNVFGFSCVLPFLQNIEKKSYYTLGLLTLLVVPLVFFENYYSTIYIDSIAAILFAYGVYLVENLKGKWDLLFLFLTISGLILLKDVGLFFAIIIIAILVVILINDIIKNRKKFHLFNLFSIIVAILAVVFSKVSWNIMININNVTVSFGEKISLNDVFNVIMYSFNDYRRTVINNFYKALCQTKVIENFISLDFVRIFIIYVSVFIYMCKKQIIDKGKSIVLLLGLLLYCFGLLVLYCFRFSEYEAVRLASYNRYISMGLFGMLLIMCFHILKKEKMIIILFFIILLFIPHSSLLNIRKTAIGSVEFRQPYEVGGYYVKNKVTGKDKIYIISQNTNGFDYWILRYTLRPNITNKGFTWSVGEKYNENDIWTMEITANEWMNYLIDNQFDYVYIYKCDNQFINRFNILFKKASYINSGELYKVDKEKRLLSVVE